jgi:hypothetical protein
MKVNSLGLYISFTKLDLLETLAKVLILTLLAFEPSQQITVRN